ncbi:MAG: DUF393 domain-containing protein [Phycisphaera sp.]|nr:MAG: DUF393 domain-containing protein [Phycisphaera sp.]
MVVLFDGVCNLCNGTVNWIIDRDPQSRCRFLALQSEAGRTLAAKAGFDPDILGTLIMIRDGRVYERSSAVLEVGRHLETPLAGLCSVLRCIPSFLRDLVYRLIAANRYRLFGYRESCRVPTPDLQARFLDPGQASVALAAAGFRS